MIANGEIRTLKIMSENGITPKHWRVFQLETDAYELQFVYGIEQDGVADLWLPVQKRDGQTKIYKTLKALLSDVQKIDKNPMIQHHGKH